MYGRGELTLWNNKMKQWGMKTLRRGIVRSTKPHYCFRLWVMMLNQKHQRYFIISSISFFFKDEKLLLLQAWWNIFFLLHKHLCECSAHDDGFSAMSFYKKRLIDSSQPLDDNLFLWKCRLYHCDIFLPTFCQYLVWKKLHITRRIQLVLPPLPFRSVMSLSCLW